MVWDGGEPSLSGTSTLTLRVCPCQRYGKIRICQGEAPLPYAGLSTGALIAILLCIVILLGEFWADALGGWRRKRLVWGSKISWGCGWRRLAVEELESRRVKVYFKGRDGEGDE